MKSTDIDAIRREGGTVKRKAAAKPPPKPEPAKPAGIDPAEVERIVREEVARLGLERVPEIRVDVPKMDIPRPARLKEVHVEFDRETKGDRLLKGATLRPVYE